MLWKIKLLVNLSKIHDPITSFIDDPKYAKSRELYLCRLLEWDTERLGTHRRCSGLEIGIGFTHLLDLVLAFDVAAERGLKTKGQ